MTTVQIPDMDAAKFETVVPSLARVAPVLEKIVPELQKALEHIPRVMQTMESRIASLERRFERMTLMHAESHKDIAEVKASVGELLAAVRAKMNP